MEHMIWETVVAILGIAILAPILRLHLVSRRKRTIVRFRLRDFGSLEYSARE